MPHFVYTNAKIFLAHFDLSSHLNSVQVGLNQELQDKTTFGSSFRGRLPGLKGMNFGIAGFSDFVDDGQDEVIASKVAVADVPLLVGPRGAAVGDVAYFGPVAHAEYGHQVAIGETAKFTASGELSSHQWVRGAFLRDPVAFTGTFNGGAVQLGAVGATQKLFAAIHVLAFTGTSFVIKVQSDDNAGFSSPTDRITFTTVAGLGSEFAAPVAGPITDDYWRMVCSAFTGTSFTIVGAVGIQ